MIIRIKMVRKKGEKDKRMERKKKEEGKKRSMDKSEQIFLNLKR